MKKEIIIKLPINEELRKMGIEGENIYIDEIIKIKQCLYPLLKENYTFSFQPYIEK